MNRKIKKIEKVFHRLAHMNFIDIVDLHKKIKEGVNVKHMQILDCKTLATWLVENNKTSLIGFDDVEISVYDEIKQNIEKYKSYPNLFWYSDLYCFIKSLGGFKKKEIENHIKTLANNDKTEFDKNFIKIIDIIKDKIDEIKTIDEKKGAYQEDRLWTLMVVEHFNYSLEKWTQKAFEIYNDNMLEAERKNLHHKESEFIIEYQGLEFLRNRNVFNFSVIENDSDENIHKYYDDRLSVLLSFFKRLSQTFDNESFNEYDEVSLLHHEKIQNVFADIDYNGKESLLNYINGDILKSLINGLRYIDKDFCDMSYRGSFFLDLAKNMDEAIKSICIKNKWNKVKVYNYFYAHYFNLLSFFVQDRL